MPARCAWEGPWPSGLAGFRAFKRLEFGSKKAAAISACLPASRACAYRSIALRAARGHSGQACLAFLNPPLAETKFDPHPPSLTRISGARCPVFTVGWEAVHVHSEAVHVPVREDANGARPRRGAQRQGVAGANRGNADADDRAWKLGSRRGRRVRVRERERERWMTRPTTRPGPPIVMLNEIIAFFVFFCGEFSLLQGRRSRRAGVPVASRPGIGLLFLPVVESGPFILRFPALDANAPNVYLCPVFTECRIMP